LAKLTKKAQNELILKEVERLNSIFDGSDENRREVAQELIKRVAFMTIQLEILEEKIKTKGPVYIFKQGAQKIETESPSQKSYNTMINRYTAAYGKLIELAGKIENKGPGDDV
jgi:hypothetical protein